MAPTDELALMKNEPQKAGKSWTGWNIKWPVTTSGCPKVQETSHVPENK